MKIYVASSWRNEYQQAVVADLRDALHEVYDFRHPPGGTGFSWREVDPKWIDWDGYDLILGLGHPAAKRGFKSDFDAMQQADACVLVLPCGRSAHLEAGWFAGAGKELFILYPPDRLEPELMYLLAGDRERIHTSMAGLLRDLAKRDKTCLASI